MKVWVVVSFPGRIDWNRVFWCGWCFILKEFFGLFSSQGSRTESFLKRNEKHPRLGVWRDKLLQFTCLCGFRNKPGPPIECHLLCWAELVTPSAMAGGAVNIASSAPPSRPQARWSVCPGITRCEQNGATPYRQRVEIKLPPALGSVGWRVLEEPPFVCSLGLPARLRATTGSAGHRVGAGVG